MGPIHPRQCGRHCWKTRHTFRQDTRKTRSRTRRVGKGIQGLRSFIEVVEAFASFFSFPWVHLKREITANALGRYLKPSLEYPIGSETHNNPRKRNKMMKTTYSTMLLVIGFMALMLMLPSAYLNAELTSNPNNSPVSISQTDTKGLNQLESPLLMAQATEEHRSSESSSSSTVETPQPVQEDRSSESSSSSSMKSTTTEAQPA